MRQETLNHLGQEVRGRAAGMGHFFDQLASELLYLSSSSLLFDVANSMTGPDSMLPASARQRLERDYAAFARTYPYVYQVRFVDAKGQEVVRVDRRGERLVTVPQHELQDKSDRYYFKEGMARESSQVYVSALDLTVEHGKVQPQKPAPALAPLRAVRLTMFAPHCGHAGPATTPDGFTCAAAPGCCGLVTIDCLARLIIPKAPGRQPVGRFTLAQTL